MTAQELEKRKLVHGEMETALTRLRVALQEGNYSEALLINLLAANLLKMLMTEGIAFEHEKAMLPTLYHNIDNLLNLPHALN